MNAAVPGLFIAIESITRLLSYTCGLAVVPTASTAVRIHGPHRGIGIGVGLPRSVDVILEGNLASIAGPIRVTGFVGHFEVGQFVQT